MNEKVYEAMQDVIGSARSVLECAPHSPETIGLRTSLALLEEAERQAKVDTDATQEG